MKCYFVHILIRLYINVIIHKVCNPLKTHLLSPKIIMLTETNICSVQNYFRGNTGRQQLEKMKNETTCRRCPPLEKFLRMPINDRAFSLSFFRYFRAFTHYKLFVSFRSLNFGCKINRINPLLVIISSKLPAITNVVHKLLCVM